MDDDGPDVFARTVDWAVRQGVETATFHILTPYPGTALYKKMQAADRLVTSDWDRFDTRHVVFRPARLTPSQLEEGYWNAYREFYTWRNIFRGARTKPDLRGALRHAAYAGGWKRLAPLWDMAIRAKRVAALRPALESVLSATRPDRGGSVGPLWRDGRASLFGERSLTGHPQTCRTPADATIPGQADTR